MPGIPPKFAVPSPLSVKVTPVGNVPLSLKVGIGSPVATTLNRLVEPVVKTFVLALLIAGAVPVTLMLTVAAALVLVPLLTVKVKLSLPTKLLAGV